MRGGGSLATSVTVPRLHCTPGGNYRYQGWLHGCYGKHPKKQSPDSSSYDPTDSTYQSCYEAVRCPNFIFIHYNFIFYFFGFLNVFHFPSLFFHLFPYFHSFICSTLNKNLKRVACRILALLFILSYFRKFYFLIGLFSSHCQVTLFWMGVFLLLRFVTHVDVCKWAMLFQLRLVDEQKQRTQNKSPTYCEQRGGV